jgi:hypothetical protein
MEQTMTIRKGGVRILDCRIDLLPMTQK